MSEATITGLFTLIIAVLYILERQSGKKRDRRQEEQDKWQEEQALRQQRAQDYNAVNNCIRLKIESGEDDVEREHRKLNKMTAAKVNGEMFDGQFVNGELSTQRDKVNDMEHSFYAEKDKLLAAQQQLLNDFMEDKDIKKENYL